MKKSHRAYKIRYFVSAVVEVELTPKEIADSVVEDVLDVVFPAEAAAGEFVKTLLERLDQELTPKGKCNQLN